jgi:WXG100 family type VII secretion target
MGNKIVVQPSVLESTAQKIGTQTTDYESLYKNLFNEVDGMAAVWQGADNIAFTQQIKGFTDDFQKMSTLMRQYSEFLKQSAATYRNTQEDIIAKARTLTN